MTRPYRRPSARARVLGILNVTPDSFSDGGRLLDGPGGAVDVAEAIRLADAMLGDGADAIDVGGISTRPGAPEVDEGEELRRVLPVVRALRGRPVWVDTWRWRVARAVLEVGAVGINDQRGAAEPGGPDTDMLAVVADSHSTYVMMHNRGTPGTMAGLATYEDVVNDVLIALDGAWERAVAAGVDESDLLVDPGVGFAKTADQSTRLLANLRRFTARPVLVGASRKSFLGAVSGRASPAERVAASVTAAVWASREGAAWVRVHDVAATVDAMKVWDALASAAPGSPS